MKTQKTMEDKIDQFRPDVLVQKFYENLSENLSENCPLDGYHANALSMSNFGAANIHLYAAQLSLSASSI